MSLPPKLSFVRLSIHVFGKPQIFNGSSTGRGFFPLHCSSSRALNPLDLTNVCGGLTSTASVDSGRIGKCGIPSTDYRLIVNVL